MRACTERCSGSSSRLPDHEGAGLVELDLLGGHGRPSASAPPRRSRAACSRRGARSGRPPRRGRARAATTSVFRSRKCRSPGSIRPPRTSSRQPAQGAPGDRPAAESGDDVVDDRGQPRQREPDVLADDAARADGERLLDHDHALGSPEASRTSSRGHGRKHLIETAPIFTPCSRSSSTTSSIVPSTEPSATTIVSASSMRYAANSPPEAGRSAPRSRRRSAGSRPAPASGLRVHQVLDLGEGLGADHRADRHRGRPGRAPGAARTAAGRRRPAPGRGGRPRSKAWVRMKPSMQTITGSESCSARR